MFTILKKDEQIIKQVAKLAASKSSMQSLENILVRAHDKLFLTSGDGSIEITAVIDAAIEQECEFTVNANRFLSVLTSCGFDCNVIMKQDAIQIKSGKKKFNLSTLDADVYPEYSDKGDESKLNINASDLISSAKSVSIGCAVGDTRYMLNGVYVGDSIVATDGHRLIKVSEGLDCELIIPVENVKKLPDFNGDVYASSSTIKFKNDNMTIKSKLIDAKYVDYDRAIGRQDKTVVTNAEKLIDAVKSAMITSSLSTGSVELNFGDKSFVKSNGSKADESVIEIDAQGDSIKFSANGKYILDALSFYSGDIEIGFNDKQMIINDNVITNVVMAVIR